MRAWAHGVVSVVTILGPASLARAGEDEKGALAEALIERAEAASGRAFDAGFRDFARVRLRELGTEELAARQPRVATEGLGGLAVPGDARRDLVFTPLDPCRVADTRFGGGSLAVGVPRSFRVTGIGLHEQGGNPAGCGVPVGGAVSALVNFVAVNPVGPGNLRAWAYSTPPVAPPNASIVNYASVAGLNIANAIAVPLCDVAATSCPFDLLVQADGSGTHLVVDVVGYFHRLEVEGINLLVENPLGGSLIMLTSSCQSVKQVTISVPRAGKVLVQAAARFVIQHNQGAPDQVDAHISTSPTECTPAGGGRTYQRILTGGASGADYVETGNFFRIFAVAAGTHTFHLTAKAEPSPAPDFIDDYRLVATFHPQ